MPDVQDRSVGTESSENRPDQRLFDGGLFVDSFSWSPPKNGFRSRLLDLAAEAAERLFAMVVLVVASPLMVLIALAIRIDSRGKAIFTQQRIARLRKPNGNAVHGNALMDFMNSSDGHDNPAPTFTLYKFRTYRDKSDRMVPQRAKFEFDPNEISEVFLQLKDDPRITRVGRFLRRSSLDELPNFINVLKGEMRLIGPRPEVREMYRYYTPEQLQKFSVKPGITGLAQVNGRGKLNFKETLEYDLWYVRNRSWRVDMMILLKTFKVVLTGDGSF